MQANGSYEWVMIGKWPDGHPIQIPVIRFGPDKSSPRIWIQAGVHGDEFNGIEICHQLSRFLERAEHIAGHITIVPVTNAAALWTSTGHSSIDFQNLSTVYPGNEGGLLSERLAGWIVRSILDDRPQVVFDLHTGSIVGTACGYAMCPAETTDVSGYAAQAAYWLGTPWIYRPAVEKHRFRETLWKSEILAITAELGGGASIQPAFVHMGVEGLVNVMRWMGILPGTPVGPERQVIIKDTHWTRVSEGGLFHPLQEAGATVGSGGRIGEVWDWQGKVREEIFTPINGVVMLQRTQPVVRTGDWAVEIGNLDTSELNRQSAGR